MGPASDHGDDDTVIEADEESGDGDKSEDEVMDEVEDADSEKVY